METPPWGKELASETQLAVLPLVGIWDGLLWGGGPWPIVGDFFQGWKPLPTAASASGGGLLELSLLH